MREYALQERDSALRIYGETDALLHETRAAYETRLADAVGELRDARIDYEVRLAELDAELRQTQADYRQRDEENTAARAALGPAQAALRTAHPKSDDLHRTLGTAQHSRS